MHGTCTWLIAYHSILHVSPYLIVNQCIITSTSTNHPLQARISYDVKFHTKAASGPSLRKDMQDLDLWLEHFPGTVAQPNCWPCNHCGSTTHYPNHCPFCSSPSCTYGGGQPPYGGQPPAYESAPTPYRVSPPAYLHGCYCMHGSYSFYLCIVVCYCLAYLQLVIRKFPLTQINACLRLQ